MELLRQYGHHCTIYAAAMVLDTQPQQLINEIGHDGTEIIYPDREHPHNMRGVHKQEILDCFARRGYGILQVEIMPVLGNVHGDSTPVYNKETAVARFLTYLTDHRSILYGQGPHTGEAMHAVAYERGIVYDPVGVTYNIDDFIVAEAWIQIPFTIIEITSKKE
jgi:hypothetical protein